MEANDLTSIPAPVATRPDALLIGAQLGVFYGDHEAVLDDASLLDIMDETRRRLLELGYAESPALIIQWDASYPRRQAAAEPARAAES
jgi:hypothetical protein